MPAKVITGLNGDTGMPDSSLYQFLGNVRRYMPARREKIGHHHDTVCPGGNASIHATLDIRFRQFQKGGYNQIEPFAGSLKQAIRQVADFLVGGLTAAAVSNE